MRTGDYQANSAGHWPQIARMWEHVRSPLRPCAEDLGFFQEAVDGWVRDNPGRAPRVLVLGVTQELYRLRWPVGTRLLAIDHTIGMIQTLWPGPRGTVICGDWTALPLAPGTRDIVLCDGGLELQSYPAGHLRLVEGLQRVVASGGLCVFRLYLPPRRRERTGDVLADLLAGKVADLNHLKLRIWTAMQGDVREGVRLSDVWDAVHGVAPDFEELAARIGWTPEHLHAIDTYRGCASRYHFVTFEGARELFTRAPGGFEWENISTPGYPLGERCPTVVMRRTGTPR